MSDKDKFKNDTFNIYMSSEKFDGAFWRVCDSLDYAHEVAFNAQMLIQQSTFKDGSDFVVSIQRNFTSENGTNNIEIIWENGAWTNAGYAYLAAKSANINISIW